MPPTPETIVVAQDAAFSFEVSTNAKGQVQWTLKARGDDMDVAIVSLKKADTDLRAHFGNRVAGA